jgi:hypothetical protein
MSEWISVKDRLPEDGQEIFAFIDMDAMNPSEADRIRFVQGVINGMPLEDRSIPLGRDRCIELFHKRDIESLTQRVMLGFAGIQRDDDGAPYLTLETGARRQYVMNSDCTTHWQPHVVPAPPQPSPTKLEHSEGDL